MTEFIKRPSSAYMLFMQKNRQSFVEKNPGAAFGDIGKALAQQWKSLSQTEKLPYEEDAKKAKTHYEEKVASGAVPKPIKRIRKEKQPKPVKVAKGSKAPKEPVVKTKVSKGPKKAKAPKHSDDEQ